MSRWLPNAAGRLHQAALELYAERGYDDTPVAEIAARAGLTGRTFFRHFADKREALFYGSGELRELIVNAVSAAPATVTPMEAIAAGLVAAGTIYDASSRAELRRQAVIDAIPRCKSGSLSNSPCWQPARRGATSAGVQGSAPKLTAEAGIGVFRVALENWVHDNSGQDFVRCLHDAVSELRKLAVG